MSERIKITELIDKKTNQVLAVYTNNYLFQLRIDGKLQRVPLMKIKIV